MSHLCLLQSGILGASFRTSPISSLSYEFSGFETTERERALQEIILPVLMLNCAHDCQTLLEMSQFPEKGVAL